MDRWEFYAASDDPQAAVVERVEEAGGPDDTVTRREFYAGGVLARVEEDTNLDGRTDKWETYAGQRLRSVALDLAGRGVPTRRLIYTTDGNVERIESDEDGDGVFEVAAPVGEPAPREATP